MPPSPDRRAPPVLGKGRFVVTAPLGDGGTAGVYLAWDHALQRWVAVKVLLNKHLRDDEMRRRFRAEAATMARLSHPNIVALVHHDMDASPPYLVMELARCGSVMGWIKDNGPMPAPLAVDVLLQVCEALGVAHAQGIVHRDVKPHNFLMDDHGHCKLTDFGIAWVDDATSLTATGSQIGTFSFMAPEQRSNAKGVDSRADIYALGASLYAMLAARTSAELFIAEDEPAILEPIPPAFHPVVIRACAYRPDDRYATMAELQAALLTALARLPSSSSDYPPLVRPAGPLPAGPPTWLASLDGLDDLVQSLALDLDQPTFVPSKQVRAALSATPAPLPSGVPDYIDPAERAREASRIARMEAERTANLAPPPKPPPPVEASVWVRGAEVALYGLVLLGFTLALGLGASGVWVGMGRSATNAAAERFAAVLQAESSVVYDVADGNQGFEQMYARWDQARGPEKVAAAVAFADALERASRERQAMAPEVEERVAKILAARDGYADAYDDWRARATGFPGSIAVSLGIARSPAER